MNVYRVRLRCEHTRDVTWETARDLAEDGSTTSVWCYTCDAYRVIREILDWPSGHGDTNNSA